MSFSWLITNLLAAILLPPFNGLLLAGLGIVFWHTRPRLARFLVIAGVLLVTALSLGVVARALLVPLEAKYPALAIGSLDKLDAEAIVVLSAARYRGTPEFSEDDVIGPALDRLRYAALLARQSKKPLLVTGGAPDGGTRSEAEAMRVSLERDFGVSVRWLESASDNTLENARLSAEMLRTAGVQRIALVTHAWHMPRAVAAFEAAGLKVLPAPTGYMSVGQLTALDFVPRAGALHASTRALHEWIGQAWYALRR
ncbi:MAG: YdcF family protein [Rhodocyclaceae bacterium]